MSGLPRILIVDDSRVVRASLAGQLKGHYEIREEGDGEAAWQALVLDHELRAVISDRQMPRLDGFRLLERIRSSKLRRLQQLPFILVTGDETEEERERAKRLGVSDFIGKGSGAAEVLTRLGHLLALSTANDALEDGRGQMVQDPETGLFTRKYLELQGAQALSRAARHGSEVSVMVLALDNYPGVCQALGAEMADLVGTRLAKMLSAKIRQGDSLGHLEQGQYAIVSPGSSLANCAQFATRVRQAVESAPVSAQGKRLQVTISIGVAGVPQDRAFSAGALLELAAKRMKEAMQAGGNQVILGGEGAAQVPARQPDLREALGLLRAGRPEAVLPHIAALGLQLAPLLHLMNEELDLNLPMAEIEQRLNERAR